jgi:hypothetical protein
MFTVSAKYEGLRYLVFIVDICNMGELVILSETVEKGIAFERFLH